MLPSISPLGAVMMSLDEIFHANAFVRTVRRKAAFMEIQVGLGRPESDLARQGFNHNDGFHIESVIEEENSLGICLGLIGISFELNNSSFSDSAFMLLITDYTTKVQWTLSVVAQRLTKKSLPNRLASSRRG